MSLPLFYEFSLPAEDSFVLSEPTSRHLVQVLRMKTGEQLQLTNGKGDTYTVEITNDNKKASGVKVLSKTFFPVKTPLVTIAISLLKNPSRFEWFLEKATEIGISTIIPLLCSRTEKHHFRFDRMNSILQSAMLQSQQCWLPSLTDPVKINEVIQTAGQPKRFIAHCLPEQKELLSGNTTVEDSIILIGPEGDFTKEEIQNALQHNFLPVSLGETRLRSETAGMVASVLLRTTNFSNNPRPLIDKAGPHLD